MLNILESNDMSRVNLDEYRKLTELYNFSLIRLGNGDSGKVPIENGWQRWCIARRIFDDIGFQPGDNAGIACGPASGVLVLDIDDADAFIAHASEQGWQIPDTFTVRTGSGKHHYYYKFPEDGNEYGCRSIKTQGFDIRGLGGQVVAPGSLHPVTGNPYIIDKDIPIALAPEWLKELARREDELQDYKQEGDDQPDDESVTLAPDIESLPVDDYIKSLIREGKPEGERSEALITVLNALVGAYIPEQAVFAIFDHYPIGEKYREKGTGKEKWLRSEIANARAHVTTMRSKAPLDPAEEIAQILAASVIDVQTFAEMELPEREMYLSPWLHRGTLSMVCAKRGVGKTLLCLAIAFSITRKVSLGSWMCENPAGVLYIDGEMSANELQERIRMMSASLPEPAAPFAFVSAELLHLDGHTSPNIVDPVWRQGIYLFMQRKPQFKVLVLDNIASLSPGIDENEKDQWDPINQWLLTLRRNGVAVILVHHTNKNGDQRGSSAREDNLDISIKLEHPPGYKPQDGADFYVEFTKARGVRGEGAEKFRLQFTEQDNVLTWHSENVQSGKKNAIIAMLGKNMTPADITDALGCCKGYVSRVKTVAIEDGLLNSDGNSFTEAGRSQFASIDIDRYLD